MSEEINTVKQTGIKRKIIIGLITVILIVMMFPKGESIESEVTEGAIWTNDDLIAPFSFPIIKEKQTYQKEVKDAERSVYPVFNSVTSKNNDSLKAFAAYIISVIDENLDRQSDPYLNPTFLSSKAFTQFLTLRKLQRDSNRGSDRTIDNLFTSVGKIADVINKRGILNLESDAEFRDSIAVRVGNVDRIEPITKFYFYDQARRETRNKIRELNYSEEIKEALIEFTIHFVYPNIVYNEVATNLEIEQAKNNVSKYAGIAVSYTHLTLPTIYSV